MRLARRFCGLLALELVAALAVSLAPPAVAAAPARASSDESALLAALNAARHAHGLAALSPSADLVAVARQHSAQMRERGTLFHTASFDSVCCWHAVAENVGAGGGPDAVHDAFMRSSVHRANILMASADDVGVGTVRDATGVLWVTEVFRDRASHPATPPRPVAVRRSGPPVHAAAAPAASHEPAKASRSRPRQAPTTAELVTRASGSVTHSGYRDPVRAAMDWQLAMAMICSG